MDNVVWVVHKYDFKGRATLVAVYAGFDEAMEEVAQLLLAGDTVSLVRCDVIEKFGD